MLDRYTGREVASFPPPPGGFGLPFTLSVPKSGHLVVLDAGGFPPQGPPIVYDYRYRTDRRGFRAELARTVNFAGNPLAFAEDVEVLPERRVRRLGVGHRRAVAGRPRRHGAPGHRARAGRAAAGEPRRLRVRPGAFTVGGLPFAARGNFAPGAGSLAVRGDDLYLSSTCQGGVQKVKISTLLDSTRPAAERARRSRWSPTPQPYASLEA